MSTTETDWTQGLIRRAAFLSLPKGFTDEERIRKMGISNLSFIIFCIVGAPLCLFLWSVKCKFSVDSIPNGRADVDTTGLSVFFYALRAISLTAFLIFVVYVGFHWLWDEVAPESLKKRTGLALVVLCITISIFFWAREFSRHGPEAFWPTESEPMEWP